MLKCAVFISLIILKTTSLCTEGCLKCNTSDECLISDTANFYYLNNKTALKYEGDNCYALSLNGLCLQCDSSYYLDPSTQKCIAVQTVDLIPNCGVYSSSMVCLSCKTGYFMNSNECEKISAEIPNCRIYENNNLCTDCRHGYVANLTRTECVKVDDADHCRLYSFVECRNCKTGFVLNNNEYLNTFRSNFFDDNIFYNMREIRISTVQDTCSPVIRSNCISYDAINRSCKICDNGYYLTSTKTCEKYPTQTVSNCYIYLNIDICSVCNLGYIINNGACQLVSSNDYISNCLIYDRSVSTVKCLKCYDDYYLSFNECIDRENSLETVLTNCAHVSPVSDTCTKCEEGYVLTKDSVACIEAVFNCTIHYPVLKGQIIRCKVCEIGYYLKVNSPSDVTVTVPTECYEGFVNNCAEYEDDSPYVCTKCMNQYILSSSVCISSDTIDDCTTYSSTEFNKCEECNKQNSFTFEIGKQCVEVTSPIPYCLVHGSESINYPECEECEVGYYISDGGCEIIPLTNCVNYDGVNCTLCNKGYALSSTQDCRQIYDFIDYQCLIDDTMSGTLASISNVQCSVCMENSIAYDFKQHFVCVSSNDFEDMGITSKISGCLKYSSNGKCLQCDTTGSTPYLYTANDGTTSCVYDCAVYNNSGAFNMISVSMEDSNNKGSISAFNICLKAANIASNCYVHGPNIYDADSNADDGNGNPICLKCISGTLSIVDFNNNNFSMANPDESLFTNYIPSEFSKYPQVSCVVIANTTQVNNIVQSSSNLPLNCQYYINKGVNSYSCIKCQHGYTSSIDAHGNLNNCSLDDNCLVTTYNNLNILWQKLFSCHKCANNNYIPFLGIKGTNYEATFNPKPSRFDRYNINVGGNFLNVNGMSKNINCLQNNYSSLGFSDNTKYSIAANCALAILITNSDGDGQLEGKYGTFCAGCKPGYYPVFDDTYEFVITECIEIQNCSQNGTWFNSCSNCNTGYIFEYDENNSDYFNCIPISNLEVEKFENCYAAISSDGYANECYICKKGYTLNYDGYCEIYEPLGCSTGAFRRSTSYPKLTLNWTLYLQGNGVGCNKCNDNSVAVMLDSRKEICLESKWIKTYVNTKAIYATYFIPHCKNYKADSNNYICSICQYGYVINGTSANAISGDECIISTAIPDCAVASDSSTCLKCINLSYSLVSNKCVVGNIPHCEEYNYDNNSVVQECKICISGYYLDTSSHKCIQGRIPNCERFFDNKPHKCQTCISLHILINTVNDYNYCYPISDDMKCAIGAINYSNNWYTFTCQTCNNPSLQIAVSVDVNEVQTTCMPFIKIENCNNYDINNDIEHSTILCISCNNGFYLDQNSKLCIARSNNDTNCEILSSNKDICTQCFQGYFVVDSGKRCEANPQGITNCEKYSDAKVCSQCVPNTYLSNNTCFTVTKLIKNCIYYASNSTCQICDIGYVLNNNTCLNVVAMNCETYESTIACATCPKNYGLKESKNIIDCVLVNKPNCKVMDQNDPYNCITCEDGFYNDNGNCLIPTLIANCISYSNKIECEKCVYGYALSTNRKMCTNSTIFTKYISNNCSNTAILETPVCSQCEAGYYFISGYCIGICSVGIESGCYSCDPGAPSTCLVCLSGYYMDMNGTCISISGIDDGNKSTVKLRIGALFLVITLIINTW